MVYCKAAEHEANLNNFCLGGLAEWFMAQVLKTCGSNPSEVRILYPPPPIFLFCPRSLMDKTEASGASVGGSIPPGGTLEEGKIRVKRLSLYLALWIR